MVSNLLDRMRGMRSIPEVEERREVHDGSADTRAVQLCFYITTVQLCIVSSRNCSSADFKHDGFCFKIYRKPNLHLVSWYSARNNCFYDGGDLAVIDRTSALILTSKLNDGRFYWSNSLRHS